MDIFDRKNIFSVLYSTLLIPLKPLVYQNWYMQNTSFGTHIPEMVYTNLGKIPIMVYGYQFWYIPLLVEYQLWYIPEMVFYPTISNN